MTRSIRRAGLTLIEISLVIIIIVGVIGIAIAGYQTVQTNQRQAATYTQINSVYAAIADHFRNAADYGTAGDDLIATLHTAGALPPRAAYTEGNPGSAGSGNTPAVAATAASLTTPLGATMRAATCAGSVATCGDADNDEQFFYIDLETLEQSNCVDVMNNFVSGSGSSISHVVGFAHSTAAITATRFTPSPFQPGDVADTSGGCQATDQTLRIVFR